MCKKTETADGAKSPRRTGLLSRFRKDKRGSVAIEFVLLALPFSMLTFAVIETSVSFGAQQILANSADDLARDLRTGDLRAADVSLASIKDAICDDLSLLVKAGCPNLYVDLKSYPSFANVPTAIPFQVNGNLNTTGFGVSVGGPSEIHSLRVFYKWPVITDLMAAYISSQPDHTILMYAMMTWRNEPFPL